MKRPHADREVGRGPHSPPLAALVLITATGPFCTDTYLAALPELRSAFGTTVSAVQLTITACIVGLALGLLTGGSLSDSVGRRPLLLASTLLFVVTSAVAGMSSNIGLLIALRVLQGASAGAGASIGRAIVSDCWSGTAAARRSEETFGPATLLVEYDSYDELVAAARCFTGELTGTMRAHEDEEIVPELVEILSLRVGRLLWNQWPTGVSVTAAMQHGGPYPSSTSARDTSVGLSAIQRFQRPIALQNLPEALVPGLARTD